MSTRGIYLKIVCDFPGCSEEMFAYAPNTNADKSRENARSKGWLSERKWNWTDYCPKHKVTIERLV